MPDIHEVTAALQLVVDRLDAVSDSIELQGFSKQDSHPEDGAAQAYWDAAGQIADVMKWIKELDERLTAERNLAKIRRRREAGEPYLPST